MTRRNMFLRMIMSALFKRRGRLLVAVLAVAIGATTVSGLVTVTYEIPKQMSQEFRAYGANLVVTPSGDSHFLQRSDMEEVTKELPDRVVVESAPYRYETFKINEQPFLTAGTDLDKVKEMEPSWSVDGEWPTKTGEILIGQDVSSLLNLNIGRPASLMRKNQAGDEIFQEFMVSGILRTGGSEDNIILMSSADMENFTETADQFNLAQYSINTGKVDITALSEKVNEKLPQVSLTPVKRITSSETKVLGTLSSLLWLVATIVLTIMLVGVSTTMMAVVTERRKEIALKKALGAEDRAIVQEFLGEGVLLGMVGGLLGSLLGFGFAQVISVNVFYRSISIIWPLIPITVLVSVVVTVVACIIPVQKAMDIQPAVVLKGE